MTTSDYLESLQDDLSRTVEALNLEEGTNFTDIADMAENGDISTGGGGEALEQLFETHPTDVASTQQASWAVNSYFKGLSNFTYWPDIYIDDSITTVVNMFARWTYTTAPKVIFNDNVTTTYSMFRDSQYLTKIDVSGYNMTNVSSRSNMFYGCKALAKIDLSSWSGSTTFAANDMFAYCEALTEVDMRNVVNMSSLREMFYYCSSLQKVDLRSAIFPEGLSDQTNIFFQVPSSCLVIVKDATAKSWIKTHGGANLNVKTIDEYEASLNS